MKVTIKTRYVEMVVEDQLVFDNKGFIVRDIPKIKECVEELVKQILIIHNDLKPKE